MAAYGLARRRRPVLEWIAFLILCIRMLPPVVMALPLFLLMKRVDLLDTRIAVIAAHTAFNLPFVIWMMREFIRALPMELEESAMVDGLGRGAAFFRILLPLLGPSLVAVAIFCLVFSFSEFLLAFILTQNTAKTLPVFIGELDWQRASAAGTAFLLPILVFGLAVQKYLIRGPFLRRHHQVTAGACSGGFFARNEARAAGGRGTRSGPVTRWSGTVLESAPGSGSQRERQWCMRN